MFKFDFEVNNEENSDQTLSFETEPDDLAGVAQTIPELEPFTELSLDQLVRGSLIQPKKLFETNNLVRLPAKRDILLSTVHPAVLWSWICYVDSS